MNKIHLITGPSKHNAFMDSSKQGDFFEKGGVFTSKILCPIDNHIEVRDDRGKYIFYSAGREDYLVNSFENYAGYIKKNSGLKFNLIPKKAYRFKVISELHQRQYHNFFYVTPLREIKDYKSEKLNYLDSRTSLLINKLGEFLLGLGWDKNSKKHYVLKETQKNWDWFYDNFM